MMVIMLVVFAMLSLMAIRFIYRDIQEARMIHRSRQEAEENERLELHGIDPMTGIYKATGTVYTDAITRRTTPAVTFPRRQERKAKPADSNPRNPVSN